jgi:hypothetical protein
VAGFDVDEPGAGNELEEENEGDDSFGDDDFM